MMESFGFISNYNLRHFCRYAVIDVETSVVLAVGEKYRNFIGLQYIDAFRLRFFGGKKVYQYVRFASIKGRKCAIVFWVGHKTKEPWNKVMPAGAFLSMRGQTVCRFGKNLYMNKFLKLLCKKFSRNMKKEYRALKKRAYELRRFQGSRDEFLYSVRMYRLHFQRYMDMYNRAVNDFEFDSKYFVKPFVSMYELFLLDDGIVRRNNEI